METKRTDMALGPEGPNKENNPPHLQSSYSYPIQKSDKSCQKKEADI